jgi:signal transduction histidine kinase
MSKAQPIQQFFLRKMLKYVGAGLVFLFVTSLAVAFILARGQVSTDLQETAVATAHAFHDRILDGDIRSVEPQIRQLLKIREGESAQILNSDLSRVYESFATSEKVRSCPAMGLTCFDGWFGQARILVPISLTNSGSADRYLYISKHVSLNWTFLITVFAVFSLGYAGLLVAFFRVSKLISSELAEEILLWSRRLNTNAKDTTSLSEPPLTELEPLRNALAGLNAQIEKFEKTATDKARLLLLRGIAHDLLTPVARLQLYISSFGKSIDQEKHANTLTEIRDSLASVTAIASQVKTLNDLDASGETTELVTVAQQEVRSLRDSTAIGSKSIALEFRSAVSDLASPFSKTEISRILSNLVQNAADASKSGGTVQVEVGRSKGGGFISVKDSGCGISEDAKSRVFDPDFTLKPGTGTGLGLAIVKYICERRSAQIELQSQVNAGTTVTIRMPEVGGSHV